ncbi:hypothetical protein BGW39_003011 [Mortierella sp. 14UC]|nr:hypothetical protein BGW39_003011 [Mortierella sp. 14UC]
MKSLTINRTDVAAVEYCEHLESLTLLQLVEALTPEDDPLPSLSHTQNCKRLKELELPPWNHLEDMRDFQTAMVALNQLETLVSFQVEWEEQVELLNTGRIHVPAIGIQDMWGEEGQAAQGGLAPVILSEDYALPAIKELEITNISLAPAQEVRFVSRLFFQRPLLERLELPNFTLVPLEAVTRLEWSTSKSESGGISEIEGAISLRRLALHEMTAAWTQEQVFRLMTATPGLENLDLSPFPEAEYDHIRLWLQSLGKDHILARQGQA